MVTSNEFKLPDVGEGLTEADIVAWHVSVGDTVKVNDPICDIETAKSVVELPSPYAGVVQALLVDVGAEVQVGTPIIRIGDEAAAESASVGRAASAPVGRAASASERVETNTVDRVGLDTPPPSGSGGSTSGDGGSGGSTSGDGGSGGSTNGGGGSTGGDEEEKPLTLVGSGPKEAAVERRARRTPAGVSVSAGDQSRVLAKPSARKLAQDLGVDLGTVTPERADGVVTTADLDALLDRPAGLPAEVVSTGSTTGAANERREPIKGLRKTMGQAMVDSAFTLPHVTIWTTVDVTLTSEFVAQLKGRREFADVKVSPLLVVAKACLLAVRRTPIINSYWDDAAQEIVFKSYVNLGIAAATPRGLQVPNIKGADAMALVDLGKALNELTATARTGKTPPVDQAGGTFTITNIGPFGIDGGAPIINPGESAILSVGAIKRQPWVVGTGDEERIEPRDVCTIALSFDHRHIDGEAGSRFLADVGSVLSDPVNALLL